MKSKTVAQEIEREPVYWFSILETSRERGDIQALALAQRELREMGIVVTYPHLEARRAKTCK